jgi:hypothetical protein
MSDAHTPSDQLAGLAFDSLVEAGILRTERRANLVAKLASGKMSQEDWSLEIELAASKDTV